MKILALMVLLALISVIYHVSTVFAATGVTSNKVTTKVGTPTEPVPGGSTSPTNSGPLGVTVTCPLFQNGQGTARLICGTFKNIVNNSCGHGNPSYYIKCTKPPYASCPFSDQLKAAVDARLQTGIGNDMPVYLPFINGNQSVEWNIVKVADPISGGADGYKFEYETVYGGKRIRIDLTHLNQAYNNKAHTSGDQVGTTKAGIDTDHGGHLHTAASIDGVWGDSIDQTFICSNRTP